MIAKLKGKIDTVGLDHLLIDVNGVCYQVFVSIKTLHQSGIEGDNVVIFTEMVLRNELPYLYGFSSLEEQECFRLLTTVQGVGARVALAILSVLTPQELTLAIYNQDKAQITRAEGVGPKLAVRILTELKDKAGGFADSLRLGGLSKGGAGNTSSQHVADAFAALESLGYRRNEIAGAIQQVMQQVGPNAKAPELIRLALATFGN